MNAAFAWIYYLVFFALRIQISDSEDKYALDNFMSAQWRDIASIEEKDDTTFVDITVYILDNHRPKVQNSDMHREKSKGIIMTTETPKTGVKNDVLLRKMLRVPNQGPVTTDTPDVEAKEKKREEEEKLKPMPHPTITPEEENQRQKEKDQRPKPHPTESSQVAQEQAITSKTTKPTEAPTISKQVTWKQNKKESTVSRPPPAPTKSPEDEKRKLKLEERKKLPTPYPTLSPKEKEIAAKLEKYKTRPKPHPTTPHPTTPHPTTPHTTTPRTTTPHTTKPHTTQSKTKTTSQSKTKQTKTMPGKKTKKVRLITHATKIPCQRTTTKSFAETKEKQRDDDVRKQRQKLLNQEAKLLLNGHRDDKKNKEKQDRENDRNRKEEMRKEEEDRKEHEKNVKLMYMRHKEKLLKIESFLKGNVAASMFVKYEIHRIQKTHMVYDEYRHMISQLDETTFQKPKMAVLNCFNRFFGQIRYPLDLWNKYYRNRITIWDPWVEEHDEFPFKEYH